MEGQADKFAPCDDYIVSPGRHVDGCMQADCFAQTAFDAVSCGRVATLFGNRQPVTVAGFCSKVELLPTAS